MKQLKKVTFISFVIFSSLELAQADTSRVDTKNGVVTFTQVRNVHAMLSPKQQHLKALVPKEKTTNLSVTFSETQSVKVNLAEETEGSTSRIITLNPLSAEATLRDTVSRLSIRFGELADVNYMISQSINAPVAIIPIDEAYSLLGYDLTSVKVDVGKTEDGHSSSPIIIRYTKELPSSISPFPSVKIPGAVLEVLMNDGALRITATNINFSPVDAESFTIPDGSLEITEEQLTDLLEEEMEKIIGVNAAKIKR